MIGGAANTGAVPPGGWGGDLNMLPGQCGGFDVRLFLVAVDPRTSNPETTLGLIELLACFPNPKFALSLTSRNDEFRIRHTSLTEM
jgi:hypothetical protein